MESHLLQMRGLKLSFRSYDAQAFVSHLLQMRGLKLWHIDQKIKYNSRIFYRCVD